MNDCQYEDKCIVYQRHREYCPQDESLCDMVDIGYDPIKEDLSKRIVITEQYIEGLENEAQKLRNQFKDKLYNK